MPINLYGAKNMNMISTGTFLTEMDASKSKNDLVTKLVAAWEKKNAKVARAGGVSLMALSLAACGSSDSTDTVADTVADTAAEDTTTVADTVADTTPVVVTPPASQSFAGTTGLDTFTGGAGADSFSASNTTLNAGDSVTGGEGADTLAIFSSAVATIGGFVADGIETISVSATDTVAANVVTVNLGSVTGETGLQVSGSSSSVTFTNTDTIVPLTLSYNSTGNVVTTYNATTVVGTADAMTLNTIDTTSGTVSIAGIETLTINNSGTSSIALLTTTSATTVNVTGSGTLTLTDVDDATTTIDMNAFTGTSTVNGIGAIDATITGGTGKDTVIVAMANIDANDTVAVGDGADTLRVDDSMTSSAAMAGFSGFETVELRAVGTGANDDTIDASIFADSVINIRVADTNNGTNAELTTVSNAGNTQTVNITDSTNATDISDANDGVSVTVTQKAGIATSADVLNTTLSGETVLALTANEYETVNLATAGTVASSVAALSATSAQNVVITGSKNLTLTAVDIEEQSATKTSIIDASALTGKLTATITNDEGDMTITGGSANDSITLATNSLDVDDTIDLGAGTDTLVVNNVTGDIGEVNIEAERLTIELLSTSAATIVDLRNVDTLERVTVDLDTTDSNITVNNMKAGTSVILADNTAATTDVVTLDGASGAASVTVTFSDVAVGQDFDARLTANYDTVTLQSNDSLDDSTIVLFSGTTIDNLNILGAGDLTITSATNTTSLDVLDAGTMTGGLTLTSLARASSADITLGTGNDSINLVTTSHGGNTIAAGSGTDTLVFTGASSSNILIDLSSAADQVTNVSAAANAAAQTGFENVTATAITIGGITLTGSGVANTVLGSLQVDTITSGTGALTVTGDDGGDVINVTSSAGRDTIIVAGGDSAGSITGAGNTGSVTAYDIVTGFNVGTVAANKDVLDVVGTGALATAGVKINGADTTLTVGGDTIDFVTIAADQEATFVDGGSATDIAADAVDSNAILAVALQALQGTDIGGAGDSVWFTGQLSGVDHTWVYTQTGNGVGGDVVDFSGVKATALEVTASTSANLIFIA
jgi:hypothetical protein